MTHLKRLTSSKSVGKRKFTKYIARPNPGPHSLSESITILYLLRDILNVVKTSREAKVILNDGQVLIDGKIRKSVHFPVGFMDNISISTSNEHYMMVYDERGKLQPKKIDQKQASQKICKVINKTVLHGNKIQINLYDSKNILVKENSYKPGDSVLISLPDIKPQKHLKLEKGALVFLTGGKHKGKYGKVEDIKIFEGTEKNRIIISSEKEKIETLKDYAFVIDKEL